MTRTPSTRLLIRRTGALASPGRSPADAAAPALIAAALRLAHRLDNDLAVPSGVLELLTHERDLPPRLRELVHDAARGIAAATQHVAEFQSGLPLAAAQGAPPVVPRARVTPSD